jgi:hypothetical protein
LGSQGEQEDLTGSPAPGQGKPPLSQRIASFFSGVTGLLTGAAALIGAVLAILTATGVIGGEDSGAHAQPAAATTQTWAARANAVCARANDTTGALPDPHSVAPTDVAGYLKTAATLERRMLRELNALPAPKDKEAEIDSFLTVGARMSDATSELANDVTVGNLAGAQQRASLLSRLNTRFNNAAVALGARTCAEGSSLGDVFGG